jgi:hypothetical protein
MKQFGVVTKSSCEYDLTTLISGLTSKMPKGVNAFYELFIQDKS